jgi:hypothetical protein
MWLCSGLARVLLHPTLSAMIKPKGDTKTTIIIVIEGSLNATHLTTEMERLVVGKGKWVVEEVTSNMFKISFPSKGEMQCMIEWGALHTKDRSVKMIIEECGGCGNVKQVMKKVWIQMLGLLVELSDFLTIWAIGTIRGVITRDVDMRFT